MATQNGAKRASVAFFEKGPHPKMKGESGMGGGKSNEMVINEVVIGINGKTDDNDNDRR